MRTALRYSTAVVTVALAVVLTAAFSELLAPMRLFFLWSAVLVTAVIAGSGPGLLATALALIGALFLAFTPTGALRVESPLDIARMVLFASFAGGLSIAVGRAHELAERLRKSEQRYRTLVEATPVAQAVWTATPDGKIAWARQWSEITGRTAHELEKDGGVESVHPDDVERTSTRWKQALESGSLYDDEIRVRVASGRYRWFAIKASPVHDEQGRIREWAGIIVDIHDRKRHEANAAFINAASELLSETLASEEAMLKFARLCVPALGDWCAIHLAEGDRYRRLVAVHADPTRLAMLDRIRPAVHPPGANDSVQHVIKTGRTQLVESRADGARENISAAQFEAVTQLGIHSWIIAPLTARGRTLGALTVASGESGRRHSADEVPFIEELARRAAIALDNARLYEAAEAANRAKDEFLATLSHELRTPLTAISGWAHMLESGIEDPKTRALAIETIARSARAQGELIDDLLDLSRVVAGTLHLTVNTVDFAKIVGEVLIAARPAADARGLTLAVRGTEGRPVLVRGDDRRLRQIVWNLVTNAVKFTDRGGSVTVTVSTEDGSARVEVEDTGRGIDPNFLPHVWDRFRQADSSTSRQYGGLGLGLAVVRHLVEMHGGTVGAKSEGPGHGSTFRVDIPLAPEDASRNDIVPATVSDAPILKGRRILLVDDDQDARTVLKAMLEQFGANVISAESVLQALGLLADGTFDVIVSDIAMPDEDGYSLVRRAGGRVPAVAVSAMGTAGGDDRKRALAFGFSDFVRKPVDPHELANAVRLALTKA